MTLVLCSIVVRNAEHCIVYNHFCSDGCYLPFVLSSAICYFFHFPCGFQLLLEAKATVQINYFNPLHGVWESMLEPTVDPKTDQMCADWRLEAMVGGATFPAHMVDNCARVYHALWIHYRSQHLIMPNHQVEAVASHLILYLMCPLRSPPRMF